MEELVYIEVLDKHEHVQERHRIERFPATLGRAYTNDVIISDPEICPQHAEIAKDEDGSLWVHDLGSINGVVNQKSFERVTTMQLSSETRLLLGSTTLRIRTPQYAVADTVPSSMHGVFWRAHLLSTRKAALMSFAMVLSVLVFVFTGFTEPFSVRRFFHESFSHFFPAMLFVVVWSGIWALLSKVLQHRSYWLAHLIIAMGAVTVWVLELSLVGYLHFMIVNADVARGVAYVLVGAFIAALIFAHLSFCSNRPASYRLQWAGGVAGLLVGVGFLMRLTASEAFSTQLQYNPYLKPPSVSFVRYTGMDDFQSEVQSLKQEIDARARD